MTRHGSAAFAVAILRRFNVDPTLIGDIIEEYERSASPVWLWRQVIAAGAFALIGRAREPRPHIARTVNMSATPAGSPVGGLGLVAVAGLITVVVPDLWWVLAAAAVCGSALGAGLIVIRRRRPRASPGRTIVVVALLGIMTVSAGARGHEQRVPAVRLDPVDGIIEAFRSHPAAMLRGGHGSGGDRGDQEGVRGT